MESEQSTHRTHHSRQTHQHSSTSMRACSPRHKKRLIFSKLLFAFLLVCALLVIAVCVWITIYGIY